MISRWICYDPGNTISQAEDDFMIFISDDSMKIPIFIPINTSLIIEKFPKMQELLKNDKRRALIFTKNPFEMYCLFRYLNNKSFSLPLDRLQVLNDEFKRYEIDQIPTTKFYQIPTQTDVFLKILSKTIKSGGNYHIFTDAFMQNFEIFRDLPQLKEIPLNKIIEMVLESNRNDLNPSNLISQLVTSYETETNSNNKKLKNQVKSLLSEINRLNQTEKTVIASPVESPKPTESKVSIIEKNAVNLQNIAEILAKVQQSNEELLELQKENEQMRNQNMLDKNEIESLRFGLAESTKQVNSLQVQNDTLSKELFKLQKKLDMSVQKYSESMTKLSQQTDTTIQKLDDEKREIQKKYDLLKISYDKLNISHDEQKKAKDLLEIELSDKSRIIQQAAQREILNRQEKEFFEKLLNQKNKQIEELNSEIVSNNLDSTRYKTAIQQWNQVNEELLKTKKQLEKLQKSQSNDYEKSTQENKKLLNEKEQLNKVIKELRETYNKEKLQWEKEKSMYKDEITKLSVNVVSNGSFDVKRSPVTRNITQQNEMLTFKQKIETPKTTKKSKDSELKKQADILIQKLSTNENDNQLKFENTESDEIETISTTGDEDFVFTTQDEYDTYYTNNAEEEDFTDN